MTNTTNPLSTEATAMFLRLARDSRSWDGIPLVDCTNAADKGYLTAMKKHGLIETTQDEENRRCYWIMATDKGYELAAQLGESWKQIPA
jgi:hypothetical protein